MCSIRHFLKFKLQITYKMCPKRKKKKTEKKKGTYSKVESQLTDTVDKFGGKL